MEQLVVCDPQSYRTAVDDWGQRQLILFQCFPRPGEHNKSNKGQPQIVLFTSFPPSWPPGKRFWLHHLTTYLPPLPANRSCNTATSTLSWSPRNIIKTANRRRWRSQEHLPVTLLHLRYFLSYLDDVVSEVALVPKSNPTNTVPSRKSAVRPWWYRLHHVLLLPQSILEPGVLNMLLQKLCGMDMEPTSPTGQAVLLGLCHVDHLNWYFHMVTQMMHDWSCCSSSHVNMSDKTALRTRRERTLTSWSPPTLEKQHVIKLEAAAPQLLDECWMWVCQTHLATVCALGMCWASLSTPRCLPLPEHATRSCFPLRFTLHVCFALFCPPGGEPHTFWAAFEGDLGQPCPIRQPVPLMLCDPCHIAELWEHLLRRRCWSQEPEEGERRDVLPHVSKQVCWDKHLEVSSGWLFRYGPWWA